MATNQNPQVSSFWSHSFLIAVLQVLTGTLTFILTMRNGPWALIITLTAPLWLINRSKGHRRTSIQQLVSIVILIVLLGLVLSPFIAWSTSGFGP